MQQGMGFIPNFNAPRTTEGHVISCIFKPFVTRLTASLKFLKSSDNVVRVNLNIFFTILLTRTCFDWPRDALHGVGNDLSAGPGSTFFVVDETMDKSRKPGSRKGTG